MNYVLYNVYTYTNISGNLIKHNLRTSINERIHFFIIYIYIYISHTLFSKGLIFLWCVRGRWRDILSSSRSQGVPTLAPPCKLVRDASGRLHVHRSTAFLCTLSKSHCVILITWSPSSYTHVRSECPDRAVLFTDQNVSACQAHGVTRNEPKIHDIYYITIKVSLITAI